ncbi:MAG: helix-turn-helix domain-containing protein [Chitinophagaceae bacterium]
MPRTILPKQSSLQTANITTESTEVRVAELNEAKCILSSYNRRDFFKATLILEGFSELNYSNSSYAIDRPALVFTNRLVPYSWDLVEGTVEPVGYFCVFTEAFLQAGIRMESLKDSVLYKPGGNPVYFLNDEQLPYLTSIFVRMRHEMNADYIHKYDLLRNQLSLVIHEAIKMQPATTQAEPINAAARITKLFFYSLDSQFPVASPQHEIRLKKASDYAEHLTVHINHLNAALHQVTGKSTTMHINDRLLKEAKSLLAHTGWAVADIAYSLGFEYASYFNNFFKKHTGVTPLAFRKTL